MADLSKEELSKEIADILKDADLKTTTSKKVRQQLEKNLDCSLTERKKEIDDLVMEYLSEKEDKKAAESGSEDGEEEEEEEEEPSEEEEKEKKKPAKREPAKKAAAKRKKASSEEDESASASDDDDDSDEYSPRKSAPKKGKAAKKGGKKSKKSAEDSGSDAEWGKSKKSGGGKKKGGGGGKGSGYTRQLTLSPELAAIVGANQMARYEVVKKLWAVIKEKNLFDPKNKQFAICDDDLFKVIGVKRFRTFAMMKYLKNHFVD